MIRHFFHNPSHLLAMADMRGNLVAVAVLLALGVVVLRLVKPASEASKPRWWLVGAAFGCGPAAAFALFVADILWISPHDYLETGDYTRSLLPILVIGFVGGAISAATFGLAENASCCRGRKLADPAVSRSDERKDEREPE